MPKFYVTYGVGSNLADSYSVVEGEDYEEARNIIDEVTKRKFAFVYDEKSFKGQPEKYALTEVPLQPQVMFDE